MPITTTNLNPSSNAIQAVGQAIVSSLNPAGSTSAQLVAVRSWVASHPTDSLADALDPNKNGALVGNPVAQALNGTYKLTTADINAFYTRYNVQNVIDQDGTGGTSNTGLQVIRAIDAQTGKQALFVAGADPVSEFIPVGTRQTSYFGGAIVQGKALVDQLNTWQGQGIDFTGAVFATNSLGASTLAMALPNTNSPSMI